MFSTRSAFDLTPNRFGELLAERRRAGAELLDLTESNPTRCGFSSPGPDDLAPLAHPAGLVYEPTARGGPAARQAVARYYADRGVAVDPDRVLLAASTSEAYGWLFKLLADDGDEVLSPRPSYPLFDYLAGLEGVRLVPYRLEYRGRWWIDIASLRAGLGTRARAVLLVSPNNPTGSSVTLEEWKEVESLAAPRGVAVIADEVFADFGYAPGGPAPLVAAASARHALTFTLSGLSKVCGLPQLKLAWIVVGGPAELARQAVERLELVADTYLSVSTPAQLALPRLLERRRAFQEECHARVRANRLALHKRLAAAPGVTLLEADAGWYACLRVPRLEPEEELVLGLLHDGVVVHPGYFFDFAEESHLVVSLLPAPETFRAGVDRVLDRLAAR